MNKTYFKESEKRCLEIFSKWNSDIDFLKTTGATPELSCIDASGETSILRCAIELKNRKEGITTFKDVFVESKKLAYLYLMNTTHNFVPLYINFFNNGKEDDEWPEMIALWHLKRLTDWHYYPSVKTHSNGFEKDEYRERFGLLPDDAAIYRLIDGKYKLVKKIGEKYVDQ